MKLPRNLKYALDEDTQSKVLIRRLSDSGINFVTVHTLGVSGKKDSEVLSAATAEGRALVTRNCGDFVQLHKSGVAHSGILLSHHDKDEMGTDEIVLAITNISTAYTDLSNTLMDMRPWVYEPVSDEE